MNGATGPDTTALSARMPSVTVRPVVHTIDVPAWLRILDALGARTLSADPLWTEVELDRGRVTLSGLVHGAQDGEVVLGLETADLAAYAAAVVAPPGMRVDSFVTRDYSSLRIVTRDGLDLLVDPSAPGGSRPEPPSSWVQAHWYTPDVQRAGEDLEAMGLVRTASTSGGDDTFDASNGVVLVRSSGAGAARWGLSIAVSDLDGARSRLLAAGVTVEEANGGTNVFSVPFPGGAQQSLCVVDAGR